MLDAWVGCRRAVAHVRLFAVITAATVFAVTARGAIHVAAAQQRDETPRSVSGRILFSSYDAPGLYTMRPDGTGRAAVVTIPQCRAGAFDSDSRCYPIVDAALSPDGKRVAYARFEQGPIPRGERRNGLFVADVDGKHHRRLVGGFVWAVGWSPDGTAIAYAGESATGRNDGVFVWSLRSGRTEKVSSSSASEVVWSPNGKWLAFVELGASGHINLVTSDGRIRRQLRASWPSRVDWAPDSLELAYTGGVDNGDALYTIRRDGTARRRLTSVATTMWVDWAPRRGLIAVVGMRGAGWRGEQVMLVDVVSGTTTWIDDPLAGHSAHNAYETLWAPDGSKIAFTRMGTDADPPGIYVQTIPPTTATRISDAVELWDWH